MLPCCIWTLVCFERIFLDIIFLKLRWKKIWLLNGMRRRFEALRLTLLIETNLPLIFKWHEAAIWSITSPLIIWLKQSYLWVMIGTHRSHVQIVLVCSNSIMKSHFLSCPCQDNRLDLTRPDSTGLHKALDKAQKLFNEGKLWIVIMISG